jgi:hypothetical protein
MKQLLFAFIFIASGIITNAQGVTVKEKTKTKIEGPSVDKGKYKNASEQVVSEPGSSSTTVTSHQAYSSHPVHHTYTHRRLYTTHRNVHHVRANRTERRTYTHVSHHAAKSNVHNYKEMKKKESKKKYKVKYKY